MFHIHLQRLYVRVGLSAALVWAVAIPCAAREYQVGPGKPYTYLREVPWTRLGAGDSVAIFWQSQPYREKILVTAQGTALHPIRIHGVPGPQGQLPVLDGQDATTDAQFHYPYPPTQDRGLVILSISKEHGWGFKPRYIEIANLELRNASIPNAYSDGQGLQRSYSLQAAALFVERGEHITVRGCVLTGSGNGLFVASGESEELLSRDIHVENCSIYGNGNVGSIYEHNAYTEALGITYQFNCFGPLRAGALGNNLKDRSAGTLIRYNWIEGGGRLLDLVEAEDSFAMLGSDARYHQTEVEGNILLSSPADGWNLIHYGGDKGNPSTYRKGLLKFNHNTVVVQCDQDGDYGRPKTCLFRLETDGETLEAQHNLFFCQAATPGAPATELGLMYQAGEGNFNANWISPGWGEFSAFRPVGTITGTASFQSEANNAPHFQDLAHYDLRLVPRSLQTAWGTPEDPDVTSRTRHLRHDLTPLGQRKTQRVPSKREKLLRLWLRVRRPLAVGLLLFGFLGAQQVWKRFGRRASNTALRGVRKRRAPARRSAS